MPTRALQHMLGVHIGVAIWRQHIGQTRQNEDQDGDDHAKHSCLTTSQATESNAPRTRRLSFSPNDSTVGPPRAAVPVYGHCGHAFIRQGLLSSHTSLPPRSAVLGFFSRHYASALP